MRSEVRKEKNHKPATTPAEKIKSGGAEAATNSTPRNHQIEEETNTLK